MKNVLKSIKKLFVKKNEEQECPKRAENWIANERFPLPDYWEPRGTNRDLCCSFCGSWEPRQFLAFCKQIVENPTDNRLSIEYIQHKGKMYIRRPNVQNADHGAIKFYVQHLHALMEPMMEDERKVIEDLINKAIKISNKHFEERWSAVRNATNQ